MRNAYKIFIIKSEGRDHAKDLDVDGKIMLEWVYGNRVRRCGLDASGSGCGPAVDCCERDNEPSGSKNCGEFLD
jgi:hypothetical protein